MFRLRLLVLASVMGALCLPGGAPKPAPVVAQATLVALSCSPREVGTHCDRDGSIGPTCCAEHPRREPKRRLRYV